MRAREPDEQGYVIRDGVRVAYECFGSQSPSVLFLPSWSIAPSLVWKFQVPHLARHARVITFDPRGNGRSDHPRDVGAYAPEEFVADALEVLDATGTSEAVLVALSRGNLYALQLAAQHPDRVLGWAALGPTIRGLGAGAQGRREALERFNLDLGVDEGWNRYNRHSWLRAYDEFVQFFFGELLPEPHSSKQLEDCFTWAMDIEPEVLVASELAIASADLDIGALFARVKCPVVVVHGTDDRAAPPSEGERVAELTGGRFIPIAGAGHLCQARHPVAVNRILSDLVRSLTPRSRPARPRLAGRRPRALYLSSPIGLGHVRRDLAIARALREERPDLDVQWLSQSPVTEFLEQAGEIVHPASSYLAHESAHIESEAGEHDLHAFAAVRRMDEILVNNFMVFDELVARGELRPVGRRRGVGPRPLPAREPGAEAGAVRVDDRLRGLDADARRRRARGVPDLGLERRDDRARRPVPPPARPVGLRR